MQPNHPTQYPEVNQILNVLLPEIQAILRDQFIGMYLYGSLAYGGFDRESDVDYVVVTAAELPETTFSALQEMHDRIARIDSWCATQLEGSYLPRQALRIYDPVRVFHLHLDRGRGERLKRMQIDDPRLSRAWWGGWVFLRAVLWKDGVVLAGPNPRSLIEPTSAEELKQAAQGILHGWAEPLLENPHEIEHHGYQAYIILTLCRTLYTLRNGKLTSKQAAARWAQEELGQPWAAVIERAWAGRRNPGAKVSPKDLKDTQDFIRYALEHDS